VSRGGFCEYFDPLTGDGLGGGHFSWTAAIALYWVWPTSPVSRLRLGDTPP
jgi:hypothetical protein